MISVALATHNEERNLAMCLEAVKNWADEIVIADGDSTDRTVEIAESYGAKVIKTTNKPNFHINKQMAIDATTGDLILQLDADEVVDEELRKFILQVHQNQDHVASAWWLRRKNLFLHHWLKKGGQYPDMVIRLFWREQAYLPQKDVHEQMEVKGTTQIADGHLLHYAYPDFASYIQKFNTYTTFKALQLRERKTKINFRNFCRFVIFMPLETFFSIWLRHRGYVDGWAGFIFALGSGYHHAIAYLKLYEMDLKNAEKKPS